MRLAGVVFFIAFCAVGVSFARFDMIECISMGEPFNGRLINGDRLMPGDGYYIKPYSYTYATPETIAAVKEAVARVKELFPDTVDVVIGDLSKPKGGPYYPHESHQSGRDVDIGYYQVGNRPQTGLVITTPWSLDVEKTWALIESLLAGDKVEYIFMDYSLQRVLYFHAARKGLSRRELARIFQYPRGRSAKVGIIRYSRGHAHHMHVRFRSPRAVLAAEKYTADELWQMYYTQPAGGKVAFYNGKIVPVARLMWHVVKSGESYSSIAKRYRVTVRELQAWNRGKRTLKPGARLAVYLPVSDPSQIDTSIFKATGHTAHGVIRTAKPWLDGDVGLGAPIFFEPHIFLKARPRMPLPY